MTRTWLCPFHDDKNPSFCIDPGKAWWRCYGCGEKGDAANLVMKIRGCRFPEAVEILAGGPVGAGGGTPQRAACRRQAPEPPSGPEGMTEADAVATVEAAADRIWRINPGAALTYLIGPDRRLSPETIRAARLGYVNPVRAVSGEGKPYEARGIVIPWYAEGRLTLVKVRQPGRYNPKYAQVYRHRAIHLGIYPGPEVIQPGRPLIIVEGEFDALLLGQELGDLAAVVTLGSASARPSPAILGRMLAAAPWYVATDADDAGDRSAAAWPAPARRVRPPRPFKDWTHAKSYGLDLVLHWSDVLSGIGAPPLST